MIDLTQPPMTADGLYAWRNRLEAKDRRNRILAGIGGLIYFAYFGAAMLYFIQIGDPPLVLLFIFALFLSLPLMVFSEFVPCNINTIGRPLSQLSPMALNRCPDVLAWCDNPVIRAYQAQVTAQGRELTEIEYQTMKKWVAENPTLKLWERWARARARAALQLLEQEHVT